MLQNVTQKSDLNFLVWTEEREKDMRSGIWDVRSLFRADHWNQTVSENLDRIYLVQDRIQWRVLVNTVINFHVRLWSIGAVIIVLEDTLLQCYIF
jgi:hypothetical protein